MILMGLLAIICGLAFGAYGGYYHSAENAGVFLFSGVTALGVGIPAVLHGIRTLPVQK